MPRIVVISFVGQYRAQARGGLGRYEVELFRHLKDRLDITYAAAAGARLPSALVRLASLARRDVQAVVDQCPLIPQAELPDLVHLTNQNLASALVFQRPNAAVVTVHDVIPFRRPRFRVADFASCTERVMCVLRIAGLRRAHRLIAVSAFTKQELVSRFHMPPDKIVVAPWGVDRARFCPGEAPDWFTTRYAIEPGQPLILYVGSQAPRKNLATLYHAFARLRRQVVNAQLWIVGGARTPRPATLDQLGLGLLAGAVRYVGHVPEEDLPHFYNAAAVLALPSLDEGFGLPVIEAMAAGCPVVAARATSLPEVVREAGILVDPLDIDAWVEALLRVLTDVELAAELREAGLQRAQSFCWNEAAELTMLAYRETLDLRT